MASWFEIVDASDEEAYFTLGGFPTLESAIKAVNGKCKDSPIHCEYDRDEYVKLEIREHSEGWGETKKAWSQEWRNVYDEEKDDSIWERVS